MFRAFIIGTILLGILIVWWLKDVISYGFVVGAITILLIGYGISRERKRRKRISQRIDIDRTEDL